MGFFGGIEGREREERKRRKKEESPERQKEGKILERKVVGNMRCERSVFDSLTKSGGWRQG